MSGLEQQPQQVEDTQYFLPPFVGSSEIIDRQSEVIAALTLFRSANVVLAHNLMRQYDEKLSSAPEQALQPVSILPPHHHADVAANGLLVARNNARKRLVSERLAPILERQRQ